MCGRFTVVSPADVLANYFGVAQIATSSPRFNIAPTQDVLAIRAAKNEGPEPVKLRWGLIPSWAKDIQIGSKMINARCETLSEKPAFRNAYKRRRCLIAANGFYEWVKDGKQKQPFLFRMDDFSPFAMAGLWERWQGPDKVVESCTIITTHANELLGQYHDRMPVILAPSQWNLWFNVDTPARELQTIMVPRSADEMMCYPVSKVVNKAGYDGPECIAPIEGQARLF